MSDSDIVSLKRPGTWPRKLRLGLEAIVTVMTNAHVTPMRPPIILHALPRMCILLLMQYSIARNGPRRHAG